MAWHLEGQMFEACSCKSACPCALGPAEPDQGWCSGAFAFTIQRGASNGVDLSGRTVLWLIDLPGDFLSGNGTARVYVDDAAEDRQARELEAIFTGKKGGPGEVLASLVSRWLPTRKAPIVMEAQQEPAFTVGDVGQLRLKRIADERGRVAKLIGAPVLGAIQIETADLARGDGSSFADPEMRRWESGGHGTVSPFTWRVEG